MAKLLYSATMSLDGFIAGPEGDMSWLTQYLGPNPAIDELMPHVGALLVGQRTFGGDDPYKGMEGEGEAFGGGWSGPSIVLTHWPPQEDLPETTFASSLKEAIRLAKDAAGDKYVNVLGASVARQCLAAGELDEILVCIAPVMLGDGVRLYDFPGGGATVRLERMDISHADRATNLWFRVLKS
ncbi:dihydrofolate reductase family protein [Hoyosella altamirensis]|uniref:dihydrofolate reductase family protein n=1 Tax=Hoyosella altamirensis TaxID=616997 RepID=UPI0007DAEA79|nr:dihydrofolate reductase family protein [Hoyosella altamirensis]